MIGRRALADVDLGRIVILAGMLAVVSPWVTHRDPRWYPEPERFDPGRWEESERDARPQHAFFPFGAGTRMCIGEGFAMAEARAVLRVLASLGLPPRPCAASRRAARHAATALRDADERRRRG